MTALSACRLVKNIEFGTLGTQLGASNEQETGIERNSSPNILTLDSIWGDLLKGSKPGKGSQCKMTAPQGPYEALKGRALEGP
jgi:hypothetical protein